MDYQEKLRLAKEALNSNSYDKRTIEYIFPELKESDDERIRKSLIGHLKGCRNNTRSEVMLGEYAKWIAWLKKQGEQKSNEIHPIFRVGDYIKNKKTSDKVVIEQLDVESEVYYYTSYDGAAVNHSDFAFSKQDEWELIEQKVVEQNHIDKVEPKFKVGDWIINSKGTLRHIVDVDKTGYQTDNGWLTHDDYEKTYHLWTIQDAKAGDVLADDYGIYIFEKFDECDENCFVCIGAYQYSEKVYECEHMLCSTDVHPATKEQCDLLFAKMKEAGYEWDAEKKELKKIEQNPVSITDEWIEDYWKHNKVNNPNSYDKGDEIQFDHDGFVRFCQTHCQKPAWSEDDEKIIDEAISLINMLASGYGEKVTEPITFNGVKMINNVKEKLRNLLKKLNHWKPSDEQMDFLWKYAEQNNYDGTVLTSLFRDLENLKEE